MSSVNNQTIIGYVGGDINIRSTNGGNRKASLSVATNKSYTNEHGVKVTNTTWHNVVAWSPEVIEKINSTVRKGQQVFIEGEHVSRSYRNNEGEERSIKELRIKKIIPIDEKISEETPEKNFCVGTILETPIQSLDEENEEICLIKVKGKNSIIPITVEGAKAQVVIKYLDKGSLVYIEYTIKRTEPFSAVATNLTMLSYKKDQEEKGNEEEVLENKKEEGKEEVKKEEDLDKFPF